MSSHLARFFSLIRYSFVSDSPHCTGSEIPQITPRFPTGHTPFRLVNMGPRKSPGALPVAGRRLAPNPGGAGLAPLGPATPGMEGNLRVPCTGTPVGAAATGLARRPRAARRGAAAGTGRLATTPGGCHE